MMIRKQVTKSGVREILVYATFSLMLAPDVVRADDRFELSASSVACVGFVEVTLSLDQSPSGNETMTMLL